MILRELGDYLALHKKVSRRALARHFHTSEDAVEAMLGVWMRKGRVAKRETRLCGGSCCGKSEEEIAERDELRQEYLNAVMRNARDVLENTYIVDEKGNKRKLTPGKKNMS